MAGWIWFCPRTVSYKPLLWFYFTLIFLLVVLPTSLSRSVSTLPDPVNVRIPQGHLTLYKETEFLCATTKFRNVSYNPRAPEVADLSSSLERGGLLLCFFINS